ncbi:hypothetical protein ABKN59_003590 [Abortiporus biennis]
MSARTVSSLPPASIQIFDLASRVSVICGVGKKKNISSEVTKQNISARATALQRAHRRPSFSTTTGRTTTCLNFRLSKVSLQKSPAVGDSSVSGRATSYSSLGQALTPSSSTNPRANPRAPYEQNPQTYPPNMASDGRYMYQQPQEPVGPPYGYPNYSQPPYEHPPAQYAANPPRQARHASSQSQSPNQPPQQPPQHQPQHQQPPPPPQSYGSSSSSYPHPPPPYGPPPSFNVPPSANQQWSADGWSQYPPYQPPNPPPQDAPPFNASSGRAEVSQNAQADHRGHPAGPPKTEPRREERPSRPTETPPQSKVRKSREPEPQTPPGPMPLPLGLDFTKLAEQYRLILDSTKVFTGDISQARSAAAETLERMLGAAMFGADALDSAAKRYASDLPGESSDRVVSESESQPPLPPPSEPPPTEGQTCLGCSATSTPEWRRGPMGPRTLCNACGLVYAKLIKKRTREPGRSRSSSDDEDSYGSQERRSEIGDHGGRE